MTDEELMQLAARPDDLTGEAQGVLCSEMGSRRLRAEAAPVAEAEHMGMAERFAAGADYYAGLRFPAVAQPEPEMLPEPAAKGLAKGMVVLTTFHDAIAAGEACDWLEAEDVYKRQVQEESDASVDEHGEDVAEGASRHGVPPCAGQSTV